MWKFESSSTIWRTTGQCLRIGLRLYKSWCFSFRLFATVSDHLVLIWKQGLVRCLSLACLYNKLTTWNLQTSGEFSCIFVKLICKSHDLIKSTNELLIGFRIHFSRNSVGTIQGRLLRHTVKEYQFIMTPHLETNGF